MGQINQNVGPNKIPGSHLLELSIATNCATFLAYERELAVLINVASSPNVQSRATVVMKKLQAMLGIASRA